MTNKFYITTAIDYPNSVPHMGHAYEKTLADFYARWYRLQGRDTRFLTGLDEHGQKIQEAAVAAGEAPQAFVDDKAVVFRDLCRRLEVSNDDFIRTSEPRHHRFARDLWNRVQQRDDIYLGHYEGDYCVPCESFYTPAQLEDGLCPVHKLPTQRLQEESFFFRLSKYREWIREHIRTHPEFIFPDERRNEILARLDDEVRDLSVSRCTFSWGIPVPDNDRHILYVWFDALSNYVSALREPDDVYDRFWPADVHVIGKDIIWFHTVIWPCMLHSAGLPPPRQVYVHGFILDAEGRKMAKHLGNVVDPLAIVDDIGADVLRFYFLRTPASGHDGKFSVEELEERYQNELGNDLGNLVLRVIKLVEGKLGGRLTAPPGVEADLDAAEVVETYSRQVDDRTHHRALETLWTYIRRTNAYLNERAPWKESDPAQLARVLYNALEALRAIAYLAAPVMPAKADAIAAQLGVEMAPGPLAPFGSGAFEVRRAPALFPRRETGAPKASATTAAGAAPGTVDPFARLEIRIGTVEDVREHPEADSLYVLTVRLGEGDDAERRTICAGLRQHLGPEDLAGHKVMVLANLKPAKLRGVESRGMILATDRRDGKVVPIDPGAAVPGELVTVEGVEARPKSKLSTRDFDKAPLGIRGGRVEQAGRPLRTSAGFLTADAADGAKVR